MDIEHYVQVKFSESIRYTATNKNTYICYKCITTHIDTRIVHVIAVSVTLNLNDPVHCILLNVGYFFIVKEKW